MRIFQLIDLLLIAVNLISAQLLPDSQAIINNELEHLYFDDTGPGGFKAVIEPCTNYVSSSTAQPDNTLGQQTAAQWIRTAFRKIASPNYSPFISYPSESRTCFCLAQF